jgi:hypothetical protein
VEEVAAHALAAPRGDWKGHQPTVSQRQDPQLDGETAPLGDWTTAISIASSFARSDG